MYFSAWWPLFVLIFYVLAPVPSLMGRRLSEDSLGKLTNNFQFAHLNDISCGLNLYPIIKEFINV